MQGHVYWGTNPSLYPCQQSSNYPVSSQWQDFFKKELMIIGRLEGQRRSMIAIHSFTHNTQIPGSENWVIAYDNSATNQKS